MDPSDSRSCQRGAFRFGSFNFGGDFRQLVDPWRLEQDGPKTSGRTFTCIFFLWHREDALSACNLYSWASVSNAGPPQLITLHLMKVRSCATWNHFQKPLPLIYEYHPFPEPKYRVARLSSNANNSPCVAGIVLVTKIRLKHIDCSQVPSISP